MKNTSLNIPLLAIAALLVLTTSQFLVAEENESNQQRSESKTSVCTKHKITQDQCFICDPEQREKGRLWCKEHVCYEDRCWICHPEAQDKSRLFCTEHSLYEDECFICHPELKTGQADKGK